MADLKISQLSDGGASQAADEYVIARSGANYRIDGASVAAAATSVGTLTSLTVSGDTAITSGGKVLVGTSTSDANFGSAFQVAGTGLASTGLFSRFNANSGGPNLYFAKSRGASVGTNTIVQDGDQFGVIGFYGANGTGYDAGVLIRAEVDGSPGASNDMPGRLVFFTTPNASASPVERLRLDASGNLGLGVTPSAWSTITALQVKNATFGGASNSAYLFANAYYDGSNFKYIASAFAAQYRQQDGQHIFYNAPSGTAGNNITFTQAMTLDASGNLGVGTTSPSGKLSVSGFQTASGLDNVSATFSDAANSTVVITHAGGKASLGTDGAQALCFLTNKTERARITSGGLFQVTADGANQTFTNSGQIALKNTGSAPYISWHESTGARIGYLQMQSTGSANLYVEANQPLVFATNNTERARISSTGSFTAQASTSVAAGTHSLQDNGSSPNTVRVYNNTDSNNTTNRFIICDAGASVLRAEIRSNGGLANYTANDVNLSDERVKTDIQPAPSYWDTFKVIEIVTFKYKDQTHDDVNVGVIAQQVEQVNPVWVDTDGFGETPEGEEPLKAVYSEDIKFAAIKALQEAMARIEALEVEVAALKANA